LVLSLLHYSTTPSLQHTAARRKEYGSALRGQCKAGVFEPGFFTAGQDQNNIVATLPLYSLI
jgi:hypothetical protein